MLGWVREGACLPGGKGGVGGGSVTGKGKLDGGRLVGWVGTDSLLFKAALLGIGEFRSLR